ncbi:MAG: hypothetical protein ABIB79_00555 [archaeon]
MVEEKRLKQDKNVLVLFIFMLIVGCGIFVLATSSVNSPVSHGNYSTTMNVSVATNITGADADYNVSVYYNSSGGDVDLSNGTFLVVITNTTTAVDDVIENATVVLTGLDDGANYNFSFYADNGTDQEWTSALSNITIDNTVPAVANFTGTVDGGSYKDTIVLNVSVTDATIGVGSVYFNITNSTGTQLNFTKASTPGGGYYNITLNTSVFTDGVHNITVYSNDTLNNANNTERIQITIDNTDPVVSLALASSTVVSLTGTITGAEGTCTSSRSGAIISGSTLTETGLICSTSYTYIVTCTDAAGNVGSSASTSLSTTACGGGSSSSSSVQKITVTDKKFEDGYTMKASANTQFNVKLGSSSHSVTVKSVSSSSATIEIASTPTTVTLNVGEDTKVDVTNDGYYDIYVKLLSIKSNKADVFLQKIHELVPPEQSTPAVEEAPAVEETPKPMFAPEEDENSIWTTVVIILVVLAIIAVVFFIIKKKK